MLRHTSPEIEQVPAPQVPPVAAGEVRVKPEELVQAIAAIQARREQEARERDGTITIAEAVKELNLDVTPEELLAVVQAQRVQSSPPVVTRSRRLSPWRAAVLTVIISLGFLMALRGAAAMLIARAAPAMAIPETPAPPTQLPPVTPVWDADGNGRGDQVTPPVNSDTPVAPSADNAPMPGSPPSDPGTR